MAHLHLLYSGGAHPLYSVLNPMIADAPCMLLRRGALRIGIWLV